MTTRVLLVEDNEQNRYLVTFLMERNGCLVTHAADGPAALALAREQRFDVILLDIQLPGMDGYAVARALRDTGCQPGVPIVAVTSYAMSGDREKALAAGCDGYIEKPIDIDTFMSEVRRHLAGPAGGAP
ncbi:response regulator [Ramlibacter sp. RBP-2]|uniref:Response regulator n=1 Tax=Ramlibacter lithotrophicus TaxID=2606681 RepID=A0A7X6I8Q1_9BURK|nr:response regulator [Ramlibacter lithotrophicus]NKE68831.1 response regulator [Ramlibacter lithotrophicus]